MEREAHRRHTEALGSSAQMRCVSCWYRQSRVTAKSTSRTPRTIQILMRIRAACRRFVPMQGADRVSAPTRRCRIDGPGLRHNADWLGASWPRELLRPDRRGLKTGGRGLATTHTGRGASWPTKQHAWFGALVKSLTVPSSISQRRSGLA